MPALASFVARGLDESDPAKLASEVAEWRAGFDGVHYTARDPG